MAYEPECLHCGEPLTGLQRRVCSQRCRMALARPLRPLKACRLCGELFQPRGVGVRSVCDYETEADDRCRDLQDEAEDDAAAAAAARTEAVCQGCGTPLPYAGRGRPRTTCGATCKKRVQRARAKEVQA